MEALAEQTTQTTGELLEVTALDLQIFGRTFFPKTVRQTSAQSHERVWRYLQDPTIRKLNVVEPRGWAKTSRLRIFAAHRVAFGTSHTVLYIGASEGHATRSLIWLRGQIQKNHHFAKTFGLSLGQKQSESELEILSELDPGSSVWVTGVGITGNIRGINFEDYRPDLIILDDVLTDENSATLEQRRKIKDLIFGAVYESLASPVEFPNSKMVMLNTPHDLDDITVTAAKDESFVSVKSSCWTEETEDLPIDFQVSGWEEMKPTALLRKEKRAAIANNRYSTWARENECKLVTDEASAFKVDWLNFYDEPPAGCYTVLSIDPVPPPTDAAVAKNLVNNDFEAICVWGRRGGNYYLLEYALNRGHDPGWTSKVAFEMGLRWKTAKWIVEGVAYQRVLKYILEQEMARRRIYFLVTTIQGDKRKKYNRIVSTFNGPASQGRIFVSPTHSEFIRQFGTYGAVDDHDDLLDASAQALSDLVNPYLELDSEDYVDTTESEFKELELVRLAP